MENEAPSVFFTAGQPGNATLKPDHASRSFSASFLSDLLGLFYGLLSFLPFPDWANVVIFSSIITTFRTHIFSFWDSMISSLWVSGRINDFDPTLKYILFWLSKHAMWQNSRDLKASTGQSLSVVPNISLDGSENTDGENQLQFAPTMSGTFIVWYQNHPVLIQRWRDPTRWSTRNMALQIKIFSRDRSILSKLIAEATSMYEAAKPTFTSILVPEISSRVPAHWRLRGQIPKRPLQTVILDPGVKEVLLADCRDFLRSKPWYTDRGIPFRRGYLLYGAPGSGKTSVIQSVAGELGLSVYVISISQAGLDDQVLHRLLSLLPERSIALMEDLDAAFPEATSDRGANGVSDNDDNAHKGSSLPSSRVTLSGLINALDGIGAQEGRLLFATTNHINRLDPALLRPGRMDVQMKFELASRSQAHGLFKNFYAALCMQADTGTIGALKSSSISSESNEEYSSNDAVSGSVLTDDKLDKLATRFSDSLPEREFSMAALQGYLMQYKTDAVQAVDAVHEWVAKESASKNSVCVYSTVSNVVASDT